MVTPVLVLLIAPFVAQEAQEAADTHGLLLAGPDVVETQTRSTLLKRNFNGTIEQLPGDPFVAAVRTLALTEEQAKLVDEVLMKRYQAFDEIVGRQYGLITEAGTIDWDNWGDPKENERRLSVLSGLFTAFAPFNARGTYVEELRGVLPDDLLDQADAEARAYYQALVKEKLYEGGMNRDNSGMQMGSMTRAAAALSPDARKRRSDAFREVRLQQFGAMIVESFDRQVGEGDDEKNAFAERLDLDQQQLARIEAIFAPIVIDELQRKEITPLRRFGALAEIWGELTSAQRRVLLRNIAKEMATDGDYRRLPMKSRDK